MNANEYKEVKTKLSEQPDHPLFHFQLQDRVRHRADLRGTILEGYCWESAGTGAAKVTYLVEFDSGRLDKVNQFLLEKLEN